MNILIINPQFEGEPDIELSIAGSDADIEVWRTAEQGDPSEDVLKACDALINCRSANFVTEAMAAAMERCQIVVQAGVGYNHIDLAGCARHGIAVCNTPDYGTTEVADHAIALMLGLTRGVVAYDVRLRSRRMGWFAREVTTVRRLRGATFGVVGLGRIGTATALRARGFEMEIAFYDPYLPAGVERAFGFRRAETLEELMATSDVVSVHTPLTSETSKIIGEASLAAAKPGLYLVDTARGGTLDLDAVEAALRDGRLAGAALDVLPVEPIDYAHTLLKAWENGEEWLDGRLIVSPHAAFFSPDSLLDLRRIATRTAIDYIERGMLRACLNEALLQAPRRPRAAA